MAWKMANMRHHDRSGAARKSAASRQCPVCGRRGALSPLPVEIESHDGRFRAKPRRSECRFKDCQWRGTRDERKSLMKGDSHA